MQYMYDDFGNPILTQKQIDKLMGFGTAPKATDRNVKVWISWQLQSIFHRPDITENDIDFVGLDSMEDFNDLKHACVLSGITNMNVVHVDASEGGIRKQFPAIMVDGYDYDGSLRYASVTYAYCPYFPVCNKVYYFVERSY